MERRGFLAAALAAWAACAQAGPIHRAPDAGGGAPAPDQGSSSAPSAQEGGSRESGGAPVRIQRRQVPRPEAVPSPDPVVRRGRPFVGPSRDDTGARIRQRPVTAPPREHTAVVRDAAVIGRINRERRVEIVPNRYYWHRLNGMRYAHYYDNHIHWYGFYHGPSFYWTTYHANNWWWYDTRFDRWDYWWNGFWWWPSPAGAVYVYVDNAYYPYNERGVSVNEEPPVTAPASGAGVSWKSPDGARLVQVTGDRAEAFLYDASAGSPSFMKFLGRDVDKARFSGGTAGKPGRILLDFKDGSFALFSMDGDPLDADESAGQPDRPDSAPPRPGSSPPIPDSPPPAPPSEGDR